MREGRMRDGSAGILGTKKYGRRKAAVFECLPAGNRAGMAGMRGDSAVVPPAFRTSFWSSVSQKSLSIWRFIAGGPPVCLFLSVALGVRISFPLFFMFNVNRVTLLGNVTRDPDVRATKTGRPVSSVGFATNRAWRDQEGKLQSEPEFHNLVCFGPLAEFADKRVKKGVPLYVEGRLHTSRWESKKGGTASRTEVLVDRLVLLSSKKQGNIEAAASADE